jgi:DNA polymerase III subunit delta'
MSWQRIVGHEALVHAFTQARRRGRMAHAYLFVGPLGVGKRLFAHELAKTLLCETMPAEGVPATRPWQACDRCAACILVEAGTHPDFFQVGRPEEKNIIPLEVMKWLCQGFSLTPARGRGKVAVVDDADDLEKEGANAFLKTLEEPPPRSLFILVGTSVDRQYATIVSRCQVVRFTPLPEAKVIELLRKQGIDDESILPRLARMSGGSPGQALALADPGLWEMRQILLDGLSRPQPNTVVLADQWNEFVEKAGKEASVQRKRATLVLRLLVEFLHDAVTVRCGGKPRFNEPGEVRQIQDLLKRADTERLLAMIERCMEADAHLDRYVQVSLVIEGLLDALA